MQTLMQSMMSLKIKTLLRENLPENKFSNTSFKDLKESKEIGTARSVVLNGATTTLTCQCLCLQTYTLCR